MIISAIQPVLAIHYCGDKLHSFSILQATGIPASCCDTKHVEEDTSPFITMEIMEKVGEMGNKCCSDELLHLSTDDYQNRFEQLISQIRPLLVGQAGTLIVNPTNTTKPEATTWLNKLKFPPKGLYLNDVSLLTYICIYRI